jgi:phage tail sheath gpL-like
MTVIVSGFAPDNATPGSFRNSVFGAGLVQIAGLPVRVLSLGNKTSGGTMTADQDILPVGSELDADTLLGTGSECATVCYGALAAGGATVFAAPVAEPASGPVASQVTVLVGGSPTRNGTIRCRVGAKAFAVGVASAEATTVTATNITAAVNGLVRAQVTSTVNTSTSTILNRNTGARGNQLLFWWDLSDAPGVTLTVTGGTPIHSNLVPFASGAGADSVSNVLALAVGDLYDFIASPHNDTTNMGLIKAHMAAEALPGVSHLEHAIFAIFGTYAAASSLSTSTLNDYRSTLVWSTYLENSVAWYCGYVAGRRANISAQQPNFKWGLTPECTIVGAQPHAVKGDNPSPAVIKNALNNGLCVLKTSGADVVIVRGIITHCLSGSSSDFRARDWGDVDVTDAINKGIGALWAAHTQSNMWAEPDDPTGAPAGAGTTTPKIWNSALYSYMLDRQENGWVYKVAQDPPQSEWDYGRGCIMSAVPVHVKPKSFQLGSNVNQTA